MKKNAFTLMELMVATLITSILIIAVFNFYNVTRVVNAAGIAGQMLQDGVYLALDKMIEGKTEYKMVGGSQVVVDVYRLSQAQEYCIGSGVGCTTTSTAEMHFWGTDGLERWYKLNNAGTAIIYHHPTTNYPTAVDETIYNAPTGATLTLRFRVPGVANYTAAVVAIDVALTQTVLKRAVNGSSTTVVNLRNHPV